MTTELQMNTTQWHELTGEMVGGLTACRDFPAVVSVATNRQPVFPWLQNQTIQERVVWSDREENRVVVGLGQAALVTARPLETLDSLFDRCRQQMAGHPDLRFYGGISFGGIHHASDTAWQPFGGARFTLPRITFDGQTIRCVALSQDDVGTALEALERLVGDAPNSLPTIPVWRRREDTPDASCWARNVAQALQLIRDEVLEKIVLARRATFELESPTDPTALVAKLAAATHDCYHFCFQTGRHCAFLGASPERLFLREGNRLLSDVLAGTGPRGQTLEEDQRLASKLLSSAKDQLEHDIVRKSVRQKLHHCATSLEVAPKATILKLARKQHLYSRVAATLRPGVSDAELVHRLHPTPAVGGYPTENALLEIPRLEPFDRGWYAAPVGWISANAAEFAVAIRSGLLRDRRLALFSGAGIVTGSTAAAEWDEIENKIGDFLDVMQH